jgi:TonB family protein
MTHPRTSFPLALLQTAALSLLAISGAALAQEPEAREPVVTLFTISDLDDPAMIRVARPVEGYEAWLTPADFPADAFDPARTWYVPLSIKVAADGSVSDCVPLEPNARNSARACEVIRARGRFVHALDAEGRAQSGSRAMGAVFELRQPGKPVLASPAPPPMGYQNTKPVIRDAALLQLAADAQRFVEPAPSVWLDINAKGRVTRCRINTSTGTDAGDAEVCKRMAKAKFDPARDPQGNKVPALGAYFVLRVGP